MGPAKILRKINRITIKRYEDSPSSSKDRKTTEIALKWSHDELTQFYKAYHQYGKDWKKISAVVGHKASAMVEALYNMHRTFLSLPKRQAAATEFIALVTGHRNVLDESRSNRGNGHILTSEDAKNRGEAALQKVHEEPPPDDSCPEGAIPGFSLSFKKRYYGELASNIQTRVVGSRTLRLPVTVPADRGATPENRDTISSAKHIDDAINKDSTNFTVNESSPDGSSVVLEATEAAQAETFLETKGTADAVICPTQQHLKKRRIEHNMDGCMISKSEHDTMVAGKEGNKSVGVLNQQQILGQFISADDMLVLDVLQSLVNTRDSGTPERGEAALSHRKDDGHPLLDQSKQGKPVGECNTSKTCHNKHEMLLGEVPSEETNIAHAIDITEGSSSNSESAKGTRDLLQSTASSPSEVCPYAPRETKPERSMSRRSKVKSKMNRKNQHMSCNRISDSLQYVQARKLLHCLSSESLRRWCTYDWFYSAIDFPWFTNNEFVKYLNHLNVSHLSRLARSEWIAIRSPLGKHRRFSDHFLVTEKQNLKEYREEVRKYYAQLSAGLLDILLSDLALPFSIGQQVIVRHPRSRELCDGKVVMVKPGCCKVQFDNPKLGVELVKAASAHQSWVAEMLGSEFFKICESHGARNLECNMYCIDCTKGALCFACMENHSGHKLLQIRRSSYRDVVRVASIADVFDVNGIQSYIINSSRILYLHSRPQERHPYGTRKRCVTCNRGLLMQYSYCSIQCKVESNSKKYTAATAVHESPRTEANAEAKMTQLFKPLKCDRTRKRRKGVPRRAPLGCHVSDCGR